jgi:hypothetical protein
LARAAERRQDGPFEDDPCLVTELLQKAGPRLHPDVKPAHDADIQPPRHNQIEPLRRGET